MIGFDLQEHGVPAFGVLRHTNHQEIPRFECKSEASCTRRACLFEEVSTCSTWLMYREHIALRMMYVQTETSHSLSERKSNMPTAFVTGKRQPSSLNRLFPVRRCPHYAQPVHYHVPETPCNVVWKTKKSQPHIMPSVSLNSKPTGLFRILKRFLFSFSFSLSVV
jgi:hypothetical protein